MGGHNGSGSVAVGDKIAPCYTLKNSGTSFPLVFLLFFLPFFGVGGRGKMEDSPNGKLLHRVTDFHRTSPKRDEWKCGDQLEHLCINLKFYASKAVGAVSTTVVLKVIWSALIKTPISLQAADILLLGCSVSCDGR